MLSHLKFVNSAQPYEVGHLAILRCSGIFNETVVSEAEREAYVFGTFDSHERFKRAQNATSFHLQMPY
ncbi:hypothetical protein PPTG_23987 [Phytophthora nicotianae INRA-310]|uniref:Uncharacterized protein n=1 Tax=Phytophthora nicotianae (strain INRA-310) TaxID=761204 RepID=W2PPH9_PHYN3|nr:hypothetical protein PPTG_23987 [Phytophthora nicotianae INRA-310]ETN01920.1 hypothetical protein PPTG_23987 [Phytophthora nicotianae INRA-310]